MSQQEFADIPQRITIVLEHDRESEENDESPWEVVSYLVYDSGRRQRTTLKALADRVAAAEVLNELWQQLRRHGEPEQH